MGQVLPMREGRSHFREDVHLTEYWLRHYCDPKLNLCSLCGNSGIVDTLGIAMSPAGIPCGRLNWCICPNGQARRHFADGKGPGE